MHKYVSTDTAWLQLPGKGGKLELLWGDRVEVLEESGHEWRVRARGREGLIDSRKLGDQSLLEVYFIDVGQGDGILIRFPDDRHVLIDGGFNRAKQPSGKNAADFVDWKFASERGLDHIRLEAMICSHCDADHYGGLWDLLSQEEDARRELDTLRTEVSALYHAGVGWWSKAGESARSLGPKKKGFLTQLLGDRESLEQALGGNLEFQPQGEWKKFLQSVLASGCRVGRLSHRTSFVPGFSPEDGQGSLRVLAPIEEELDGAPVLRSLGADSQNTNGHSVLLRLDYGSTRMLLTGDLNAASQRRILEAFEGQRLELACDVAKACHHGSDDVSFEFLSAMNPAVTIISSGDSEQHAHPRPAVVAASALSGYMRVNEDRIVTPLIYSTEVARSIRMGRLERIRGGNLDLDRKALQENDVSLHYSEVTAGALQRSKGQRRAAGSYVVAGIIYGLVNVRTDGKTLLCATLNEANHTWDVKKISSRF